MWYDNLTTEIINLLSDVEELSVREANWWDEIAVAIAAVLKQYAHTIPVADSTGITKAINDLQQLVTAAQNPVS